MRKTTYESPLFPWNGLKVHIATEDLCLIISQLPESNNMSEWHSQTNGYTTVEVSVLSGLHIGYYTHIHDLKVQNLHLDLHIGAVGRVHLTFISKFSTGPHKLGIRRKLSGSTIYI